MPIEKLAMATLSGPVEMIDTALQSFVINRDFHLENAIDSMEGVKKLSPFDMKNPWSDMLKSAYALLDETGIAPRFEDFSKMGYTPEKARQYLARLTEKINSMYDLREEKRELVERDGFVIAQLKNLEGIAAQIDEILSMKYVKFRFGRIAREDVPDFRALADSREDVFYFSASHDAAWEYGLYVALPNIADQIDSVFATLGWERIRIAESMDISGTPEDAAAELRRETQDALAEIEELTHALSAVKDIEGTELLACYSYARFLSDSFDLRAWAGHRSGKFYIVGWVPADTADEFARECESIPGMSCIFSNVKGVKRRRPPTKLITTGALSVIFRPFVEMYGSPGYSEADPVTFMSVTYTIIFGVMFGDVGQGVVLSLLGLLMWKAKKMWLGRILAVVGVSATVFGFVYGSVFGNEHLLSELYSRLFGFEAFNVLAGGNTMRMLIVAVAAGMFLLLVCMIANITNGVRQGDVKKVFFSPNGLAGAVVYLAACAIVLDMILGLGLGLASTPYVLGFIALPLLVIMCSEPLTNLVTKKRPVMHGSIGMFLVEGFFELFETALSYISNTVSFLRIGAFAISHAGMMMVVYMLSGGGTNIFGVIIGNIIVMGIEATLVCIQVMRLEFYEMFGRFFSGDGIKFVPRTVDYERTR